MSRLHACKSSFLSRFVDSIECVLEYNSSREGELLRRCCFPHVLTRGSGHSVIFLLWGGLNEFIVIKVDLCWLSYEIGNFHRIPTVLVIELNCATRGENRN
jgi:hypothetical protein